MWYTINASKRPAHPRIDGSIKNQAVVIGEPPELSGEGLRKTLLRARSASNPLPTATLARTAQEVFMSLNEHKDKPKDEPSYKNLDFVIDAILTGTAELEQEKLKRKSDMLKYINAN